MHARSEFVTSMYHALVWYRTPSSPNTSIDYEIQGAKYLFGGINKMEECWGVIKLPPPLGCTTGTMYLKV